MSQYSKGFTYSAGLRRLGYTNFSLVGINSMSTQEDFEACLTLLDGDGEPLDNPTYPSLSDVVEKANEFVLQQAWYEVRKLRDAHLKDSDYVTAIANETGVGVSTEWRNYRQGLRDITSQSDPSNLVWPIHPEGQRVGFSTGWEPPNSVG